MNQLITAFRKAMPAMVDKLTATLIDEHVPAIRLPRAHPAPRPGHRRYHRRRAGSGDRRHHALPRLLGARRPPAGRAGRRGDGDPQGCVGRRAGDGHTYAGRLRRRPRGARLVGLPPARHPLPRRRRAVGGLHRHPRAHDPGPGAPDPRALHAADPPAHKHPRLAARRHDRLPPRQPDHGDAPGGDRPAAGRCGDHGYYGGARGRHRRRQPPPAGGPGRRAARRPGDPGRDQRGGRADHGAARHQPIPDRHARDLAGRH